MKLILFVILVALFAAPPIYSVYKLAEFKNRNSFLWLILGIFNFAISFVILLFLPSRRQKHDLDTYPEKITSMLDNTGYIVFAALSSITILYTYMVLPQLPPVRGIWFHLYTILRILVFSALVASLVLCIVRIIKRTLFPRVVLLLHSISVIALYLSIQAGKLWSKQAWGVHWSWDPSETLSLLLLAITICVNAYLTVRLPAKGKALLIISMQVVAAIVAIYGGSYSTSVYSHHY